MNRRLHNVAFVVQALGRELRAVGDGRNRQQQVCFGDRHDGGVLGVILVDQGKVVGGEIDSVGVDSQRVKIAEVAADAELKSLEPRRRIGAVGNAKHEVVGSSGAAVDHI